MKIAFFELEEWQEKVVLQRFPADQLMLARNKLDTTTYPNQYEFEIISTFVNTKVTKEVLDHFPNLKLVATRSTGYDHIDLGACKAKGVAVANVPGYGEVTVAEYTFGLILSLTRKIYDAIDQTKKSGSFSLRSLRGQDIYGKTIGIVGTGRIGKAVVKIAKGFGMKVVAHDAFPDEKFGKENEVQYMALDDLLARADVISIHCPYNQSTHHLIHAGNIERIKKGAYLVNTARGAIVETAALFEALYKGILRGVAVDVLEEEGDMKDELSLLATGHPKEEELKIMLRNQVLMRMPNVLVTPHNAFNTDEALMRILETTLANVKSFTEQKPINLVQ